MTTIPMVPIDGTDAAGLKLSKIIYGTMNLTSWGANLSTDEIATLLRKCIELGITTLDTADIYGDYTVESALGEVFSKFPEIRSQVQIITKCDIILHGSNCPVPYNLKMYDSSKKHILLSVENSLKHMRIDVIDLLLIHRPDMLMDPYEIAETFRGLKDAGKVKYFGVSNFTPIQFDLLQAAMEEQGLKLVTNQVSVSINDLHTIYDGTLNQCQKHRILPQAWSPLGGGAIFTSKEERFVRLRKTLEELSVRYNNASAGALCIAWLMKHPSGILPILGSTNFVRVADYASGANIELSREDWFTILAASEGHCVP